MSEVQRLKAETERLSGANRLFIIFNKAADDC